MVTRAGPSRRTPAKARVAPHPRHPAKISLDLSRYGGKWVATRRGQVVAVGESYAEVAEKVVKMGVEDEVILTAVPSRGAFIS